MIKSFLFDIGNVLLPFDFSIAMRRLEKKCELPFPLAMHVWEPVRHAYEEGGIGRAEFLEQTMSILKFGGTEAEFIAIWEDIFTENPPMTALAGTLHSQYPLYLLSNTNDIHVDYIFRRYPVFGLFAGAVYSYREKCTKPGRVIYEAAMQKFGIVPSETVFIDDLPANVQTARELGFVAIQYDFNRHAIFLETLESVGENGSGYREISV